MTRSKTFGDFFSHTRWTFLGVTPWWLGLTSSTFPHVLLGKHNCPVRPGINMLLQPPHHLWPPSMCRCQVGIPSVNQKDQQETLWKPAAFFSTSPELWNILPLFSKESSWKLVFTKAWWLTRTESRNSVISQGRRPLPVSLCAKWHPWFLLSFLWCFYLSVSLPCPCFKSVYQVCCFSKDFGSGAQICIIIIIIITGSRCVGARDNQIWTFL